MRKLMNVNSRLNNCFTVLPTLAATMILSACGSSDGSSTTTAAAATSNTAATTTALATGATVSPTTTTTATSPATTAVTSDSASATTGESSPEASGVASSTLLKPASGASSQAQPGAFPRLAVQAISGSQFFPPANDQLLARYGFVLLGGNFNAWPQVSGRSRDTLVVALKSQTHSGRNAVEPVVFQYENANEMDLLSPWFPEWTTAVQKNNWFAYQLGSSGSIAESLWDSAFMLVDMAHAVGKDSATGLYPYALLADLVYQRYYLGTASAGAGMASTHLDGIMIDNMSQQDMAGSPADWQRNGTDPSPTDAATTAAVTLGKADFPAQLGTLNSRLIAGGNTEFGYDMTPASIGGLGMTSSNLVGKLGMTMDQFVWATAGSSQGGGGALKWGGFATAMARYQVDEQNTKAGGFVLLSGGVVAGDYQLVRYSLALTLMRNGYAMYGVNASGNDGIDPSNTATFPVFDEFWGGSLNTAGYLGSAASGARGDEQSAAWLQGVWRRDFQNGIVLVNPDTNGSQTVALGGAFYHLRGGQVSSLNNGQAVSTVTLAAGDGVILLRSAPP